MVDGASATAPSVPVACSLSICPSALGSHPALLPGLLTVQVAAWDGCLLTPAFSDHQDQQAKEQGLGRRHGHLKHSGYTDVSRWVCGWQGRFSQRRMLPE